MRTATVYELPLCLCPTLLLNCNYERKTKKNDSSSCRGPLMISLKWLTALKSFGNLTQSKQIWSVLETESGGSLGREGREGVGGGSNIRRCMCVKWGEVFNEGGVRTDGTRSPSEASCPHKQPFPLQSHPPFSLPSDTQSHLCHNHFRGLNEHNKYISPLLMNAIWQLWGWQAGEDRQLIGV